MANAEDIDAPMTLEIDGTTVSPERLVRAITAFFEVVREVSPLLDSGIKPQWHVKVKQGSNLIEAYPTSDTPRAVIDYVTTVVNEGIASVEQHGVHPENFSSKALLSLRKLGRVAGAGPGDDTLIRVWVGKEANRVSQRSVANIGQMLEGLYSEYGSVSGKLQTITDRGQLRFFVYEDLSDNPVRCNFPERLVPQATGAFRQRVEVYGNVRYKKDGTPISVFVQDIEEMPSAEELPTINDVRGILRDGL